MSQHQQKSFAPIVRYECIKDGDGDMVGKDNKDNPVICADCNDAHMLTLKDGNVLLCGLMLNKPIWNSKPIWCPKAQD